MTVKDQRILKSKDQQENFDIRLYGYCHTLENHPKIFTWCAVLRTLPQPTFLPSLLKTHTNNGKLKETGTQRGYRKFFPTCINLNYKIQNCFPESESNAYIPSIQRHFPSPLSSPSQGYRSPFKRLTCSFSLGGYATAQNRPELLAQPPTVGSSLKSAA